MESLNGSAARLRRRNDFSVNTSLACLPPQQVLVATETIQRERRQLCQAEEVLSDVLFCIETGLILRCRVRLLCCYQLYLILIREIGWLDEGRARCDRV